MSEYIWDQQIDYLQNTRWLYYNDDYLKFLVRDVWHIDRPVKLVDFGCGFGYLGLKLLPLLPVGSSYTGLEKGTELIKRAEDIFTNLPYDVEFINCDIETIEIESQYDIALSHAFLLHMTDPQLILQKMIDSVCDKGRIICFEPHWIGNASNFAMHGVDQSSVLRLGVLQKLYEQDAGRSGKNGNIGMLLPILFSQLGLKNVECRVSDRVNFLDQNMDEGKKDVLFRSLREEGFGYSPEDSDESILRLVGRGLSVEEAREQIAAERRFAAEFTEQTWLTYAPNMKITSGTRQ
ncbi:class I SAM-dependent methyltransferase [Paenibacillus guangzhouensis]|uniref:class I SAM-dependent methyltransferase n=1 Tax=Paenibacillus guangzhouensis TaxID=1473112 RepID=UPI001266E37A|nr:class I SAM-dependent methyltransferase [Paenibacillus guangzhouensis]